LQGREKSSSDPAGPARPAPSGSSGGDHEGRWRGAAAQSKWIAGMLNLALFVGLANDKPSPRAAVGQSAVETSQGRAGELDRRADSSTRKVAPPSCSCWLLCRLP